MSVEGKGDESVVIAVIVVLALEIEIEVEVEVVLGLLTVDEATTRVAVRVACVFGREPFFPSHIVYALKAAESKVHQL